MENKQTAIELLKEEMYKLDYDRNFLTFKEFDIEKEKLWNQAKQMEKEQIKDAFTNGCIGELYELNAYYTSEKYYNKTYENNGNKG
jgi:hypothetical protein